MPSDLRQSPNYVWSSATSNVLGRGATSVVYRGMNKITGEPVAVKVFENSCNVREFEVLRKINHENIVRLIAIETEEEYDMRKGKIMRQILVTELCTGGCLKDILEDPENVYGLNDSEFLLVLSHLYAGMKYLRDNNIVHRDLKPGDYKCSRLCESITGKLKYFSGNIMKFIKGDGTSVYKLIDFGAARELSDEKDFKSLYGTEEYLCPDMYERAVLGVQAGKTFHATVDLWSIGVTLYHVAAGDLPFRPYGGRKNRNTMHYIITQKGPGVISGVQEKPNGPIIWSKDLPEHCLLSPSLKMLITPLIAGLLECDSKKIWSFEKFFDEVKSILSMKLVNVFNVNTSCLVKVYLKPTEADFIQDYIYIETGIYQENQILLYKSALLKNAGDLTTSEDSPLLLLSKDNPTIIIPHLRNVPKTVAFTRPIDIYEDARNANIACCFGYEAKRHIEKYELCSKLIYKTVESMSNIMGVAFSEMNQLTQQLLDKIVMLRRTTEVFEVSQGLSKFSPKTNSKETFNQLSENISHDIASSVINLYDKHSTGNYLKTKWETFTKDMRNPFATRASTRAKILVDQLRDSWVQLKKLRNYHTSYPDQYTIEKNKIRRLMTHLGNLLELEVYTQLSALLRKLEDWYQLAQVDYLKIDLLSDDLKNSKRKLEEFEAKLESDISKYNEYLKLNPKPSEKIEYVKAPVETLNKQLKNRLKMYDTDTFQNIIAENARLTNNIQNYIRDLNENNFELGE